MPLTIALVGNPNSGKTTLFNQMTGAHQYVGNWPGVTVEKKEAALKADAGATLVDLPGIYSLSPYTNEEVVARDFLAEGGVDAVVNIVDATNLERNLYLTGQLLEFGVPLVVALNQMDLVEKRGISIDKDALAAELGVPVVEISALRGEGVDECAKAAIEAAKGGKAPVPVRFSAAAEKYLAEIEALLPEDVPGNLRRYTAVKVFEGDEKVLAGVAGRIDVARADEVRAEAERVLDDDAEGIVTNERYLRITGFIAGVYRREEGALSTSQKIDRIVTNRIIALPIFVVIIAFVYYVAVSSLGAIGTDWANDGVFGEGWYIGPGQEQLDEAQSAYDDARGEIAAFVEAARDAGVAGADDLGKAIDEEGSLEGADEERVEAFLAAAETDGVTATYAPVDDETGEVLEDEAVEVDASLFREALTVKEPDPGAYGLWVPGVPVLVEQGLDAIGCDGWVKALVLDGIVAGVGAVLGFVPQIMILFFLLAILEGCGYMARVAFILDRLFRRFGLSGKSFIPLLIGTGCGVPGIMASRTIEDESSRRLTVMTTTFMPCSAKLPIIALFAGAIFGGAGWVAPSVYFIGIASVVVSGIMLRKTRPFLGDTTPFVMELPEYRVPRFTDLLRSMWERAWSFIKKAFVIILPSVVVVWFLSNFGFSDGAFGMLSEDQVDSSLLAMVGNAIAWIFIPLGWGNWQAASAAVTGLIAKENLVSTFGVLYSGGAGLWANMAAVFPPAAAMSLMLFNLLCAPCFAAMSAIRREMGSLRWFFAAIGYQTAFAYCVALCVYQLGGLATGVTSFGVGTVASVAAIAFAVFMLVRPASKVRDGKTRAARAAEADGGLPGDGGGKPAEAAASRGNSGKPDDGAEATASGDEVRG